MFRIYLLQVITTYWIFLSDILDFWTEVLGVLNGGPWRNWDFDVNFSMLLELRFYLCLFSHTPSDHDFRNLIVLRNSFLGGNAVPELLEGAFYTRLYVYGDFYFMKWCFTRYWNLRGQIRVISRVSAVLARKLLVWRPRKWYHCWSALKPWFWA